MSRQEIGTEVREGHPTILYEVTTKQGEQVEVYYQWVATDIHFPMKLAKKDGSWIVEYQHVKLRSVSDYLFNLPVNFQPLEDFNKQEAPGADRAGHVTQQGGCDVRVFGIIAGAVITGLLAAWGGWLYALDVADVVREWTPEGKKLAAERAKLPAHDEMVLHSRPARSSWGATRRSIATPIRRSSRSGTVYLDAYEIDKFEVTTVQYLKFILAKDLPPLDRLAVRRRQLSGDDGQPSGDACVVGRCRCLLHVGREAAADRSRVGKGRARRRWAHLSLGQSDGGPVAVEFRPNRPVRSGARSSRAVAALSADHFRGQVRQCRRVLTASFQMAGNVAEWVADWYDPKILCDGAGQESQGA